MSLFLLACIGLLTRPCSKLHVRLQARQHRCQFAVFHRPGSPPAANVVALSNLETRSASCSSSARGGTLCSPRPSAGRSHKPRCSRTALVFPSSYLRDTSSSTFPSGCRGHAGSLRIVRAFRACDRALLMSFFKTTVSTGLEGSSSSVGTSHASVLRGQLGTHVSARTFSSVSLATQLFTPSSPAKIHLDRKSVV